MKKIQMVDLKGQYQPIKEQVNQSIQEVIDTTAFINGPQVHEFQTNFHKFSSKMVSFEIRSEP